MDWDQVAIEADYKDSRSAKTMGSRLIKKLTGNGAAAAAAATPPVAEEDGDDAGEGSSKAIAKATKKRKVAESAQDDGSTAESTDFLSELRMSIAPK